VNVPILKTHVCAVLPVFFVLLGWMHGAAQTKPDPPNPSQPNSVTAATNYSGMYSFLRDGEFVQLTVEDNGHVIGLVSRYSDPQSDDSGFVEQFFKSSKLDGNQLSFATEIVKGISFDFHGTIERGDGKNRPDEAYYVLRGSLVENTIDETKKTSFRSLQVVLKSFPQDVAPSPAEKK
jgi:hypothetical protein